jgi:tRNA N6-adenosine threonylcarbamoyltransferase
MLILGIESSCDETSAAVLGENFEVRSNIVLSQDEIHAPYGGIVPELASRQHIRSITWVVEEALHRAGVTLPDIDVLAVTQGPGLIGSLLVGVSFAKGLAYAYAKPLVPVDHLDAHIHSAFMDNREVEFPALALLVSGGHTSLYLMEKKLSSRLLGRTRDDAAGEALDKIAKFLELGYPGGPIIDRMAESGDPRAFPFALPRMTDGSLDFSFSGFKTAALRHIREANLCRKNVRLPDFLASFQDAVVRALLSNLERAVQENRPRTLVLAGGVARNRHLRAEFEAFSRRKGLAALIPDPALCTDNAAMVAGMAMEKIAAGERIGFDPRLNAYPRRSHEGSKGR